MNAKGIGILDLKQLVTKKILKIEHEIILDAYLNFP